jgi:glycosyltransferase involved in cell wall biosynthesis
MSSFSINSYSVGRLMPNKGHRTLLRILLAYRRHVGRNLQLCVVGAQDAELAAYRAELEGLIEDGDLPCRLYDHVAQDVMTGCFAAPRVPLHERARGLLCRSSRRRRSGCRWSRWTRRPCANGGEGQLVGPRPQDGRHLFALLLDEVFRNADLRRALTGSGYRNVLTRFTGERVENAFLEAVWPRLRDRP